MSWQCHICETVNQDVTPVCTVCDHIAPVIESYLSMEAIQLLRDYNEKLDFVHSLEASGDYAAMLDKALEAMSLYKENGLAVEKAKHALSHLNNVKLRDITLSLLKSSIDKKDFTFAYSILKVIDSLSIVDSEISELKKEVCSQLSQKKDVEKILDDAYKCIVLLDVEMAMLIIEDGLTKYPSSKLLQFRRDDIKKLSLAIKEKKSSQTMSISAKYPVLSERIEEPTTHPLIKDSPTPKASSKRKFPKVKRNK